MCQLGLGACGAALSSPGRLVLSDCIGAGNRQMVNVRHDHIVPVLGSAVVEQITGMYLRFQ